MHIHALDSYLHGESPVHQLDPRVKSVICALLVCVIAVAPDGSWGAFGLLFIFLVLVGLLSQVGLLLIQKRAAVALPFTLAALTVAFATPGEALLTFSFLGGNWALTDAGLLRFLFIVLRSYLSVQAAVILVATTPFPDLLWSMRALRVPQVVVAIGGFLYRYIFVLADEVQRLLRAREARSAEPARISEPNGYGRAGRSAIWRARVTGSMAGTLFIRSYERSERIHSAMLARGYDGEVRALTPPAMRPVDWVIGALVSVLLLAIAIMGRMVL